MKYSLSVINFLLLCISLSCTQCGDTPGDATLSNAEITLDKGKVIDTMFCSIDSSHTYALYVPSDYSPEKKYPLICAFDASARGALPVRLFAEAAEKHKYLVVGSHYSRNGLLWEKVNMHVQILLKELQNNFSIDENRIYTCGFSGGGRIAVSIALYNKDIAGVLGIAAGFPAVKVAIEGDFYYLGIVGDKDFNFSEMMKLDDMLDNTSIAHQFLTYDGIHEWPAEFMLDSALLWIDFSAMRSNRMPVNKKDVNSIVQETKRKSLELSEQNKTLELYLFYERQIALLKGLYDVSEFEAHYDELKSKEKVVRYNKINQQVKYQEPKLQKKYTEALESQDTVWWHHEIKKLERINRNADFEQESLLAARLLNYVGVVSHMYFEQALNEDKIEQARVLLTIKKAIQPNEPVTFFLMTLYFTKINEPDKALSTLEKAADLGFSDVSQLENNSIIAPLKQTEHYKQIKLKIRNNFKEEDTR